MIFPANVLTDANSQPSQPITWLIHTKQNTTMTKNNTNRTKLRLRTPFIQCQLCEMDVAAWHHVTLTCPMPCMLVAVWYSARLVITRYQVQISLMDAVYQRQLSMPSIQGRLMSSSLQAMGWRPSVTDWGVVHLSCCTTCPIRDYCNSLKLLVFYWIILRL